MSYVRWVVCSIASGVACAAALLPRAEAQDAKDPRRPAQIDALKDALVRWDDAAQSAGGLEFSSLSAVSLSSKSGDLVFQADFQRELFDGMFTVIEVDYDWDGRRLDVEMQTRAAVGSRFRPTDYVPQGGESDPLSLVRASWSSAFESLSPARRTKGGLIHRASLTAPDVGGRSLRFRVPKHLADGMGGDGATTPPAVRIRAVTTCADHPLVFDYDAIGEGRPVVVDGAVNEWSGGPYVEDAGGELHPAVRHMDLRAVWCEHGRDELFLRIDFDGPGVGTVAGDGDVAVSDATWIEVQPRGRAYMDDVLADAPATRRAGSVERRGATGGTGRIVRYAAGSATLEFTVPRDPKQVAFRVAVWTEAVRTDVLRDDWLELPAEALR